VIGVISTAEELPFVREFFELFKTPWETYQPGRRYDVVLATTCELPEIDARLLILYGSANQSTDPRYGFRAQARSSNCSLNYQGWRIPLYGGLLTFEPSGTGVPCLMSDTGTAGLVVGSPNANRLHLGYDLFQEVRYLLTEGQPCGNADVPALDLHIAILRDAILEAGIPLLEIPPVPAGSSFIACLTHDIDFVGIRNHVFDHSALGFLYRASVGAVRNFARRRITLSQLLKSWWAAASLPFVYLGWAKDFWEPFSWYLDVERDLPATYFLIPFKKHPGDRVPTSNGSRRATAYDVTDIPEWASTLRKAGCELGVHGIDSWHSVEKGRAELARIAEVTGERSIGIRMHWLLQERDTFKTLENAGFSYDATGGYNETVGYRHGTAQVFRPLGTQTLLELPLHIQDGALFYPQRLDLSEAEAWNRCGSMIANVKNSGGVLTVLWHDRSHGPERFWGGFYIRLIQELKASKPWFGTAAQVVEWFRKRREIRFEINEPQKGMIETHVRYTGEKIFPPVDIRVHRPSTTVDGESIGRIPSTFGDISWNGDPSLDGNGLLRDLADRAAEMPKVP
jgi:hypothetical protein